MLLTALFASLMTFSATAPVNVATCEVSTPVTVPQDGDRGGFDRIGNYALHIRFANTSTEPISNVVFRLNDGTTVRDNGKFSPNVTIDHVLPLNGTSATSCALQSVKLADGTEWNVASQ